MSAMQTVPITVTPEAEAYIAELGMKAEFDKMMEHALQTVPGLRAIQVEVDPPYDLGGDPCVIIITIRDEPKQEKDPTQWNWSLWKVEKFPPEVCTHFVLLSAYESDDAR